MCEVADLKQQIGDLSAVMHRRRAKTRAEALAVQNFEQAEEQAKQRCDDKQSILARQISLKTNQNSNTQTLVQLQTVYERRVF